MNWDNIIIAGLAALPSTIFAAAAYRQSSKTHKAVNSRMTELLEITRSAATSSATLAEKNRAKREKTQT